MRLCLCPPKGLILHTQLLKRLRRCLLRQLLGQVLLRHLRLRIPEPSEIPASPRLNLGFSNHGLRVWGGVNKKGKIHRRTQGTQGEGQASGTMKSYTHNILQINLGRRWIASLEVLYRRRDVVLKWSGIYKRVFMWLTSSCRYCYISKSYVIQIIKLQSRGICLAMIKESYLTCLFWRN